MTSMREHDSKITEPSLYLAFAKMKEKKWDEATQLLEKGMSQAEKKGNKQLVGIYCSAFGVLFKLKKDFRKAWKFYEQAEKLIPHDFSLKLISSRLLADYFGQYDTVIRKMEKVLSASGDNFPLRHQAYTLAGFAWLKKGDKKKGLECLVQSMGDHFSGLETGANLDFKLVGEMVKKKMELKACRKFLEEALAFVEKTKEKPYQKLMKSLLTQLP